MTRRVGLLIALAFAMFFLGVANYAVAQGASATAQLNGTVTDPSGAVVQGARISVRSASTNITYSAITSDRGLYTFTNLPPGEYTLTATSTGFATYKLTGIVLTVGQSATENVQLRLETAGEQIEVTAQQQLIEPTKTEISQVVGTTQIESLPISGRLFTDFALLTPGVATSRTSLGTTVTEFEVTQISFGGMRSFSNEIMVDGADFVNTLSGVQRATPPQEAVQEFRVVNNSFGADYGRAMGGIVNIVTNSGGNDLHGSFYEYLQNAATDARSLLQPAPLPHQLRQNQFGGTLSGPIRKDKTFFFLNYEGKRRAESPTYAPDLVNNIDLIDQSKALMGLAPEGCTTGLADCKGSNISYLQSVLKTADNDWGFAKLDHQLTNNHRLAVRYMVEDSRSLGQLIGNTLDGGGLGTPSGGRNLFIRDQALVGTLASTLTPNLVNTALLQYARRHYQFPGATGQPDFSILNDLEMGHNFGTYDAIYESRFQGSESVSWVKGKHLAKFGFDGNYVWDTNNYPGFTPTRVLVPGVNCLAAFANFYAYGEDWATNPNHMTAGDFPNCPVADLNGVVFAYFGVALPRDPNFTSGPTLNATHPVNTSTWANAYPPELSSSYDWTLNHGYWAFYGQDQWRITPKLTFNYGLRWEFESGLTDYVDSARNGFQPRIGLAYSPDSKTVIRAGFGIFDDRYNMTFFFVPANQKTVPGYLCNPPVAGCGGLPGQKLPMIQTTQARGGWQLLGEPGSQGAAEKAKGVIQTGAFTTPVTLVGTCFTTGACGIGAGGMDHKINRIPYAEQASLQIDRQIGKGFALNLAYLFVAAHKLVRGNNLNVPCPVGTTKPLSQVQIEPGPVPALPFLTGSVPGMVNADGTISPCTGTPTLVTDPNNPLFGVGPWFGGALGSGLQTVSAGLWDYNNGVANAVYHGLTVTALQRWGKFFNLNANYTYSHSIDNGNFTTFINLPPNQFNYAAERANSNQDLRHHFVANFTVAMPEKTFLRNFEFSSIVTAQSGRPFTLFAGGNTLNDLAGSATDRVAIGGTCTTVTDCNTMISRNTYVGDQLYSWDLRVSRAFHLTERWRMNLMVDVFNLLNRPNVDEVTYIYGSPVFCGAVPRHYNDATSRAIQQGAASVSCPSPGFWPTPIETGPGTFYSVLVPGAPNKVFGTPRTMLNPRQLQFAVKFNF